ncbi:MAG TPA: NAD-dependent epimerase/dehydratase family protein [Actinomycetota bacterium]
MAEGYRSRVRAIVTGGAGFIGSHLVERLLTDGAEVLVLDDLSSGDAANLAGATGPMTLETVDAGSDAARAIIAGFGPDLVYHLAAQPSVVVSVRDPMLDARINVMALLSVLEASAGSGARKVVFSSSGGTVYGDPDPSALPVPETYVGLPSSPYGITKRVAHDYLAFYNRVHAIEFTALALSNVYGPRQDPHGEAGVVAIWSQKMLAGEECVVFGDGEQTRDFVYVADVVDAFARAAEAGDGEIVNVGTGVQTSVNELYRTMAASLGVNAQPRRDDARPGELRHIALDVSKAASVLGWKPETSLADGIATTTAWFSRQARG